MPTSAAIGGIAQTVSVVVAQTAPAQFDNGFDAGPALAAIALLGGCAIVLAAAGAAALGFICVLMVIAIVAVALAAIMAMATAVAAIAHFVLAVIICTRHPPTRVGMHPHWWGAFTLVFGIFAAIPFFVLHYRRGAKPRCYNCGYSLRGLGSIQVCPECGNTGVRVSQAIKNIA